MTNFDFSKIDVQDFLEELSVRNVHKKGREIGYSCPFSGHAHGDSSASATMSTVAVPDGKGGEYPPTTFYCFGCGRSGTAINFLAEYEGVSPLKARRWLRERFGMTFRPVDGLLIDEIEQTLAGSTFEYREVNPELPSAVLESMEIDWQAVYDSAEAPPALTYMLDRGFWPETLETFAIGFDPISQRISIPAFNEDEQLVGFKGRAWSEEQTPKYLVLGGDEYGFAPYEVSRILFGLDLVAPIFDPNDELIFVEGELNKIALHQKGLPNSVGFSGRSLSDYQVEIAAKVAERAVVITDDINDSIKIAAKLGRYMRVRVAQEHDEDPAEMDAEDLHAMIAAAPSSLLLR